jgi:hypothetical protein
MLMTPGEKRNEFDKWNMCSKVRKFLFDNEMTTKNKVLADINSGDQLSYFWKTKENVLQTFKGHVI